MQLGESRVLAQRRQFSGLLVGLTVLLPILHIAHATGLRNLLAAVITVWALILLGRERELPPLSGAVGAWLALAMVSSLWSPDSEATLKGVLTDIVMPMGACYAACLVSRRVQAFRTLSVGVMCGTAILAALTIFAFIIGGTKSLPLAEGPGLLYYYPGPGVASTLAVYALPFALLLAADDERPVSYAGYVSLGSILITGLGSMNRMFWVASLLAVAAFYIWQWPRLPARHRRLLIAGILACAAGAAAMVVHLTETRKVGELTEDTRFLAWREWTPIAAAAPVLGHGFGKKIVREVGGDRLPTQVTQVHPYLLSHGHNLFLVVVLQLGLVGLISFCVLLLALAGEAYRGRRRAQVLDGAALIALLVAMIVKNLTDDFMDHAVVVAFWACAGILVGRLRASAETH